MVSGLKCLTAPEFARILNRSHSEILKTIWIILQVGNVSMEIVIISVITRLHGLSQDSIVWIEVPILPFPSQRQTMTIFIRKWRRKGSKGLLSDCSRRLQTSAQNSTLPTVAFRFSSTGQAENLIMLEATNIVLRSLALMKENIMICHVHGNVILYVK